VATAGTVTAAGTDVRFTAAPAEANAVSARWEAGDVVIADSGAPLVAGAGCRQVAPGEARCFVGETWTATVDAGDGPDVLDARDQDVVLLGGAGDDRLIGGEMLGSSCGEGSGDVFVPNDPARVPPRTNGCEQVRLTSRLLIGDLLSYGPRGVRLGTFSLARRTRIRIVLKHDGVRIGSRRTTLRGAGRDTSLRVRLSAAGRKRITQPGWLTVLVRRAGRVEVGFRIYLR
jgi:hypothetical protein